ncbi:YecR family lipoprotein [Vagococcus sp. WN89Y]|uniref:YecR family lipoprotein n=1 Tax=Vagococcus sp. WN89Y TaxID=3457258 RepID=UPI003FCDF437
MSYSFGMFESPKVNVQQGAQAAAQRCAAWGYSGAEPFGGYTSVCSQHPQADVWKQWSQWNINVQVT